MTKKQWTYLKMSLSVEYLLLKKMSICGSLPKFSTYFAAIQSCNSELNEILVMQVSDKHSDNLTKMKYKDQLIEKCIDLFRKIRAYAVKENYKELLCKLDFSESVLKWSNDSKLCNMSKVLLEQASEHQAELAKYGVTAAELTIFQQTAGYFNGILTKTILTKIKVKEHFVRLKLLLSTLMKNWTSIDSLVEIIKKDEPEFYFEYHTLRKLEKFRVSPIDLIIMTKDSLSGENISFVTISLSPADSQQKKYDFIKKKIVGKGCCHFKNLNEGSYLITASKPGYKDNTKSTTIIKGERRALSFSMEALYPY